MIAKYSSNVCFDTVLPIVKTIFASISSRLSYLSIITKIDAKFGCNDFFEKNGKHNDTLSVIIVRLEDPVKTPTKTKAAPGKQRAANVSSKNRTRCRASVVHIYRSRAESSALSREFKVHTVENKRKKKPSRTGERATKTIGPRSSGRQLIIAEIRPLAGLCSSRACTIVQVRSLGAETVSPPRQVQRPAPRPRLLAMKVTLNFAIFALGLTIPFFGVFRVMCKVCRF